jgi:hypothetical protein
VKIEDVNNAVNEIEKVIERITEQLKTIGRANDAQGDALGKTIQGLIEFRLQCEKELVALKKDADEIRRWCEKNGISDLRLQVEVFQRESGETRIRSGEDWDPSMVGSPKRCGRNCQRHACRHRGIYRDQNYKVICGYSRYRYIPQLKRDLVFHQGAGSLVDQRPPFRERVESPRKSVGCNHAVPVVHFYRLAFRFDRFALG